MQAAEARAVLAKRLRKQAGSCEHLGSPLYAHLLAKAARDVEQQGPTFEVMKDHADAPPGAAVALKLMGAVHRLVLQRKAPELAMFYPSVGGEGDLDHAWDAFRSALEKHAGELADLMERGVQTNEVGRCSALLGGFLEAARTFGKPLTLLELGASAGLNLRWDHYFYEASSGTWGDGDSPVRLGGFETAPPLNGRVEIAARRGCDPAPLDPTTEEGRLTLSSYVWADQMERWQRLKGALAVASEIPAAVARSGARDWLQQELGHPPDGTTRVIFHSIVMQYLEESEREAVFNLIEEAGSVASDDDPLAWLRMEPPGDGVRAAGATPDELAQVHLTMWPGGETRRIARAGYHGRPVLWLGE